MIPAEINCSNRNPATKIANVSRYTLPPGAGTGIRGRIEPRYTMNNPTMKSATPAITASTNTSPKPPSRIITPMPPESRSARAGSSSPSPCVSATSPKKPWCAERRSRSSSSKPSGPSV